MTMVRAGLPALLEQDAEAVDGLEHGGGAAVGVDCAVDPGVAMIAGDDPVVFLGGVVPGMLPMTSQMVRRRDVLLEAHVDGDVRWVAFRRPRW